MIGYYNDPQATKEAFCNGWFKTGDLGYIDEDGFLFVTGRKKNTIVLSNGINVCPEELEMRIKVIEHVTEVIVYQKDNKIVAEVFPNFDIANVEAYIEQAVHELNTVLPKHKRISSIEFRDTEFRKTTMKKIKRHTTMQKNSS